LFMGCMAVPSTGIYGDFLINKSVSLFLVKRGLFFRVDTLAINIPLGYLLCLSSIFIAINNKKNYIYATILNTFAYICAIA